MLYLGFGGLGFGVWGLGFGVWGLGFGVWGLGFRLSGLSFHLVIAQPRTGKAKIKARHEGKSPKIFLVGNCLNIQELFLYILNCSCISYSRTVLVRLFQRRVWVLGLGVMVYDL